MPLAAVHSEYENLHAFKFVFQHSGAERKRQNDEERRGKKEQRSLLSCCVVPYDREEAAPPCLAAIAPPPPALGACSGLLAGSVLPANTHTHTCTHTHPKNVGKTLQWDRRMKTFNKSKLEVGQNRFSKDVLDDYFFPACQEEAEDCLFFVSDVITQKWFWRCESCCKPSAISHHKGLCSCNNIMIPSAGLNGCFRLRDSTRTWWECLGALTTPGTICQRLLLPARVPKATWSEDWVDEQGNETKARSMKRCLNMLIK